MTKLDCQLEIIKLLETVDSQMKGTVLERWKTKQSNEEKEKPRCVLELHSMQVMYYKHLTRGSLTERHIGRGTHDGLPPQHHSGYPRSIEGMGLGVGKDFGRGAVLKGPGELSKQLAVHIYSKCSLLLF